MCDESPLTLILGAWADRHPALVAALLASALAAFLVALVSAAGT